MVWLFVIFIIFVLSMLAIDLGVFNRRSHEISTKEALSWCAVWVSLAMAFNVFVYFLYEYNLFGLIGTGQPRGHEAAVLFFTGYVVEESLSADNIFVMALIFAYFQVPAVYQHRVLFFGILGAVVLRAVMIFGGIALIHQFSWVLYVFGAFLIYSAYRMLFSDEEMDPQKNLFVRLAKKILPVTNEYHGQHFMVRHQGCWMLTPMAIVLVAIEGADIVFAIDSIPAVFAITDISFIVFTSNIFAILGLRSMYFALSAILKKFRYLKISLTILLAVIGTKMLLKDLIEAVPGKTYITLGLIVLILGGGILASILSPKQQTDSNSHRI